MFSARTNPSAGTNQIELEPCCRIYQRAARPSKRPESLPPRGYRAKEQQGPFTPPPATTSRQIGERRVGKIYPAFPRGCSARRNGSTELVLRKSSFCILVRWTSSREGALSWLLCKTTAPPWCIESKSCKVLFGISHLPQALITRELLSR